jgi:hypothetical protein
MTTATPIADVSASEEKALPALFEHCQNVYKAMFEVAEPDDVGDLIYKGFLTRLITTQLSLSGPHYTWCMQRLKAMGCVRQLRRGGSTSPSEWMLFTEPTEALFRATEDKTTRRNSGDRIGQLRDELVLTNQKVNTLETELQKVKQALFDLLGEEK